MVCHCSVPNGFPQPDSRVLHLSTPPHPAKAMTRPQLVRNGGRGIQV